MKKYRITVKQAKLLACIKDGEAVSTKELASRSNLLYGDARNQIEALNRRGLINLVDQKGKTYLYGLSQNGRAVVSDVSPKVPPPSPHPTSSESNIRANGCSRVDATSQALENDRFTANASEPHVVIMGLSDLVRLIQQVVVQLHICA